MEDAGGAIQLAGEVKACAERRRVRSDWTIVERCDELQGPGLAFNLLDTPGHRYFSPLGFQQNTYRTLTAATAR